LDVLPFAPGGAADSFFDIYLEVQVGTSLVLHNVAPIRVSGVITAKPPMIGEHHDFSGSAQLFDENGVATGYTLQSLSYTPVTPPPPEITGITLLPSAQLQITWVNGGELRSSTTATGSFTTVVAPSSPYVGPRPLTTLFYRVYRP